MCKQYVEKVKACLDSFLESKSIFSRILRFYFGVVLGFAILSGSLYWIGKCCPDTYNFLTQWANTPLLSKITACKIERLVPEEPETLKFYDLSISITDETDSVYDLLFAVNGPGISVYDPRRTMDSDGDDRNFLVKRFVSSERSRSRNFLFRISVNHEEQGTEPFEPGILSEDDCPILVTPIKRKK